VSKGGAEGSSVDIDAPAMDADGNSLGLDVDAPATEVEHWLSTTDTVPASNP
jgi:hypothetical protein